MASRNNSSSLSDTVEKRLMEHVKDFVKQESQTSLFALGGRIPIEYKTESADRIPVSSSTAASTDNGWIECCTIGDDKIVEPVEIQQCPPVSIRWDIERDGDPGIDSNLGLRTNLPPETGDNGDGLKQLIDSCQPATFGRGMEDVYDESYRKAIKLDSSQFCTSFNPYEYGIIDSIAKVLLPSVLAGSDASIACSRGVRADLYKLNVYSAPSGMFKAHVDTPRTLSQFGSLVVCLPSLHEGGQLVVRHLQEEVVFDWASSVSSKSNGDRHFINWAAFYSDCEHEVLEVTDGHRVTLTYNLYAISRGVPYGISAIDPETLPVTKLFKHMLSNPGFLKQGAILGFHCAHAYAHTSADMLANQTLPSGLKGIDMAIYTALRAAGLEVCLRPAILEEEWRKHEDDDESQVQAFKEWVADQSLCSDRWDWVNWGCIGDWFDDDHNLLKDPRVKMKVETNDGGKSVYRMETDEDIGPTARPRILELWKQFCGRKTTVIAKKLLPLRNSELGIQSGSEIFDLLNDWESQAKYNSHNKTNWDILNDTESTTVFNGFQVDSDLSPELDYRFRQNDTSDTDYDLASVRWLNEPTHSAPAIAYMAYGNESTSAMLYSRLAVFARIPPLQERLR